MLRKISLAFLLCAAITICGAEKTTKYTAPALQNPDSWSMVIVPDTQTYIQKDVNHGILHLMFSWITANREKLNIRQVLFTGDLVNNNDRAYPMPGHIELFGSEQWQAFSDLMKLLDGKVPYILATGNHDYDYSRRNDHDNTFLSRYFPINRNPLTRQQLRGCYPDKKRETSLDNAYYEFTAPAPDKRKFLVISLRFAPKDAHLAWAKKIVDDPQYADHFVILLTHYYLFRDGSLKENEKGINGNYGKNIYEQLVKPSKNIRLVVSGHCAQPDVWECGVQFNMSKNAAGKSVAQMMFNTQAIGGGYAGSGGDGWLRLLEFMPDGKTIRARTFSPLFAISPSTRFLAWKTGSGNDFTFTLE